jgi:Transposase DDE domain group 1
MGDRHNDTVRVDFDRQIKLEFHGSTVTSDAGPLAYRELDDALRLTSTAATGLHDTRTGQNTQQSLLASSASRSTAGWPATRTSTTPNASVSIPPCGP